MCFGWADKNACRILNWRIFGKIILGSPYRRCSFNPLALEMDI
jgi:hypothetical protein